MLEEHRIAIMQPYFLPYLGYWQLMGCVDEFVIYDDVEFTKKGWIHRNRFLKGSQGEMFTLPVKKDSDYLDVVDRRLSDTWGKEKEKLLRKIEGAYRKAPHFDEGMDVLQECLQRPGNSLFDLIHHSIGVIKNRLGIDTKLVISSELGDTRRFKAQDRVLEICKRLEATHYVNPVGGRDLYNSSAFEANGISLRFHEIGNVRYQQFGEDFVPNLSVIDVMMFRGILGTRQLLDRCSLSG